MTAGVETGSWNIDVLLDGLKEGRIRLAEFGQGVSDSVAALLDGTGISTTQLQEWGKAVAAGGEGGKKAMTDVADAIAGIDDKTKQNAIGVTVFGTLWEENGTKITDTILGMNNNIMTAEANQNNLNGAIQDLNADPAVKMQEAINSLTITLAPLLVKFAEVAAAIAGWISANSIFSATIISIVSAIAILSGICMGLIPIFISLSATAAAFEIGLGVAIGTIGIVVAAIAALIAIGVLLYRNWEEISAKSIEIWGIITQFLLQSWENIRQAAVSAWNNLKEFFVQMWESINDNAITIWNSATEFFTRSIPAWIEQISQWFLTLPNKIAYALGFALGTIIKWGTDSWSYLSTNVPIWIESIGRFFSELPNKIWTWLLDVLTKFEDWGSSTVGWITTNVPLWISGIVSYFVQLPSEIWNWLVQCVNNITTWGSNMLTEAVNGAENVFNGIVDTFVRLPDKMFEIGLNIVAGIKQGISEAWDGMTGWIGSLCDDFVDGVKEALDIHSPSRVMMKLGVYTGEGFGLGIKSTISQISKQAQSMANAAIPNIDTLGAAASLRGNNAGSAGINQTVNIYSPSTLSPAETAKQNKRVLQELALAL